MSIPEPLNPNIPNARRLARRFTLHTPFHHPHLDPNLDKEDLTLVPAGLSPGGRKLNWELPRPAATNLHIKLKLTNDPDELLEEFQDKIPEINKVLGLWGEVKGGSQTATGEAQLRMRTPVVEGQGWISSEERRRTSTEAGEGPVFNLVRNLDTPGRADVIYLTDAVEDGGDHVEDSSVPSNLRTIEWLGFDGSYVHVRDAEAKMAAFPKDEFDFDDSSMRRSSTPSNLRVTEWLDDEQYTGHSSEIYVSEPGSDFQEISREVGPYETFWINHNPNGPGLALDTDEGDKSSSKF